MSKRKILIISHNPINKFDNMGKTIGNIFSVFSTEELCQLYFKNQNVDAENCEEFFCIDDVAMCKSIINRRYKTGKQVNNKTIIEKVSNIEGNIFEFGRKRNGFIYTARDLLWKIGKWNSRELKEWIVSQKITSIFLVAGDYMFPLNIAMKISKTYNIPLYVYYVDEFYRKNIGKQTILAKLHKLCYRKMFKKTIKYSEEYFCISEAMQEFYKKTFNKNGKVLMNTTNIIKNDNNKNLKNKLIISYIGNLGYDRWKNLLDIGEIIRKEKLEKEIEFNVYSGEKNQNVITKLKNEKGLNYKGTITAEEVKEKIAESDILLHIEEFSKINVEKVKYSVSTKIPDSLASGKLLLAYGPEKVESIDYIKRNNAGIIANSKEELIKVFEEILKDNIEKNKILDNAINLVEKNHRKHSNYNKLSKVLL